MTPNQAVSFLRRRTLGRAFRGYIDWVGRAVGWATVAYLIFWLVMFLIAGLELLEPAAAPLLAVPPFVGGLVAVVALAGLLSGRVPPVILNRRDVYRLALAPALPYQALSWPLLRAHLGRIAVGLLLGGVWALLSPYLFLQAAPWSPLALASLLVAQLNLRWLAYAERQRDEGSSAALLALLVAGLSLVAFLMPELALVAAFYSASPLSLAPPLLLMMVTAWLLRGSLLETYPPRFAAQSFILSELQAIRTVSVLSALAGAGFAPDAGERQRLLAQLHDRPGSTRPRRSLPLPPLGQSVMMALAWRSLQSLYRRPLGAQLGLLLLLLLAGGSSLLVGVEFAVLLVAVLFGKLASSLIGPGPPGPTLPLDPWDRTLGRILPGSILATAGVAVVSLALILAGAPILSSSLGVVLLLPLLSLALLEKYSTWSKVSPSRTEAWLITAVVAASPALLLGAFGLGPLVLPAQLLLLFIALNLPV